MSSSISATAAVVTTTAPTVSVGVSPSAVSESGASSLTYTFTRSGDTGNALTVDIDLTGTATTADYSSNKFLLSAVDSGKTWAQQLGASGVDSTYALTTGLDGSIYVSGFTYGALDGQANSGGSDAFLTKFSPDGTKAWTKLLGSSGDERATALTTGLDGSIYVSGFTYGALDGEANSGGGDAFLTKYSPDGTKAWTKLLGSSGDELANALTTGLDGSIYVSGTASGALDGQTNSGGSDAYLTKFSPDGIKVWTKLLGSFYDDKANALTTGLDGSIYVSGTRSGANEEGTARAGSDAFLTKFSSDGINEWTTLLRSYLREDAWALTTGLDGSIYVGGSTLGDLDGQTNQGDFDAFLTKFSPGGTKVWTKLMGSSGTDFASALATGLDGSIYVSGTTSGALDGQSNSGESDAFLTKYSPDGIKTWTKLLGSSGSEYANALTTGLDGSIFIGGETWGALAGQTNSGAGDAYLIKATAGGPKITFKAGESTTTLSIDPLPDSVVEGNETVIVSLLAGTGYVVGSSAVATGVIDATFPTDGKSVDLFAYSWKTHTLLREVSISSDSTNHSGITSASGAASFTNVNEAILSLTATRTIPTEEVASTSAAVNLQDAIAILKMIVGLSVNGSNQALSPYQALAADYDGNGQVQLSDAIGVLKHVVGLTAPDPTWYFVNEIDSSVPGKTDLNPGLPQTTLTADLSGLSPVHVGLVGYLSGDVDGSFAGASGASDLDVTQPDYIASLVGLHAELSLAQFGM